MKIIVTGGAGFIGTNLILFLKDKKHKITVLDNFSTLSSKKNVKILSRIKNVKIIKFDLNKGFPKNIEIPDVIVHLAANCSTARSIQNPLHDFKNNSIATLNVLEFSRKNRKIPIIYASTCKVYTTKLNTLPIDEHAKRYSFKKNNLINESFSIDGEELFSHSPYGCSKYVGDIYCQEYFHTYGIPTIINRLSTVYGKYQYGTEESGWVYHFAKAKKEEKPVTIFGSGKQVRDCLFVDDLSELLAWEISNISKIKHAIYNVGGGKSNSLSLLELIDYLNLNKKNGKKMKVKFKKVRPADFKIYISDIDKVKNASGWEPKTNISKGIEILYDSIK